MTRTGIESCHWTWGPRRSLRAALVVMALLLAAPASAADSRFDIGVVAGLNRANLNGDPVPETTLESNTSFLIGGSFGLHVREDVGLSLEPSYVRRGGNAVKVVDERNEVTETTPIDLDYLEFPLLVRVRGSGRARPYALGGLGVGFLLDATCNPPGGGSVDLSTAVRPTDVFACFGGGVEASIGGQAMFFELRYTQGLSNANRGDAPPAAPGGNPVPADFRNTALQVVAGWRVGP